MLTLLCAPTRVHAGFDIHVWRYRAERELYMLRATPAPAMTLALADLVGCPAASTLLPFTGVPHKYHNLAMHNQACNPPGQKFKSKRRHCCAPVDSQYTSWQVPELQSVSYSSP